MKKRRINMVLVGMFILSIFFCNVFQTNIFAEDDVKLNVLLSDEVITVNNNNISENTTEKIYLAHATNNGGTSKEALDANISIDNVVTINSSGTYEFTGNLSDGQIAVNSNDIVGEVIIILNGVDITCKNAPAIFVYNKNNDSTACNVVIKTVAGTENVISGGKIKQSVENWEDQDNILYYIDKGYDDEHKYYERYKYDGAISSDISLTFEGEGKLTVNALSKEGIETKRNININSGDYVINSLDDGINACTDNESVININGGTLLVNVLEDAEEGDGIDSNGYIYINGGEIYAFASEKSQDSGIDSDLGIYINGGNVVGTGNMADAVSSDSKQEFMQLQFKTKVEKNELITITDQNQSPLVAFKTDREYTVLTVSTEDLKNDSNIVYEGGRIDGTSINGLYTKITSYTPGTEKEYNETSDMKNFGGDFNKMQDKKQIYFYTFIALVATLVILLVIAIIFKRKEKEDMKEKMLTLVIGIVIGGIITSVAFLLYNSITGKNNQMPNGNMPGNMKMEKPEGEPPEKPMGDENPRQDMNISNNI